MTGEFPHKGPVTRKMFPFDDTVVIYASLVSENICVRVNLVTGGMVNANSRSKGFRVHWKKNRKFDTFPLELELELELEFERELENYLSF